MNEEEEGSNVGVIGETIEVLVEHWHQHFVNRRLIISQNELELLKLNILKGFRDILTPEIADATGLSHAAVHQAANRSPVLGVIHLMIFNEKYNKYIDLLDKALVKNGSKLSVLVKPKKKTANKIKPSTNGDKTELEEIYDIALEIRSMKIHIHAHEGGDHRFVPYWVTFTNTTVANGMFPPGNYRIWCPVYSSGQGFMQAGSGVGGYSGVYNVQLTGLSSVDSPSTEGDPTVVQFKPGSSDLCSKIFFPKPGAYLCYEHSTGKAYAVTDPEEIKPDFKEFRSDFQVLRASIGNSKQVSTDDPFTLYFQIFNENGKSANGASHFLKATGENTVKRVVEKVDPEYKDITSLFCISRISSE